MNNSRMPKRAYRSEKVREELAKDRRLQRSSCGADEPCYICGSTDEVSIIRLGATYAVCQKHLLQLVRYVEELRR